MDVRNPFTTLADSRLVARVNYPEYHGGPSEAQLRFLQTLGHTGMVPRSRREAGAWIARLRAGKRPPVNPTGRPTMAMDRVRPLRDVGYQGPLDISPSIAEATLAYLRDPEEHRLR